MNEIDVDLDLGLNPFCFETELKIETRKKNLTVSRGTELIEKKIQVKATSPISCIRKRSIKKSSLNSIPLR